MLGTSLLASNASCNQMLSANQLAAHHNDPLDIKIIPIFIMCKKQFRSAKFFTKSTLKFRDNLINILNTWSYINLSYILEITGKRFTGLLLDLSSLFLFLKTGILF